MPNLVFIRNEAIGHQIESTVRSEQSGRVADELVGNIVLGGLALVKGRIGDDHVEGAILDRRGAVAQHDRGIGNAIGGQRAASRDHGIDVCIQHQRPALAGTRMAATAPTTPLPQPRSST